MIGLTQASDYNRSAGTFTTITFNGGSTTAVVPAAPSTSRRAFLLSDWIIIPSVTRTDGGAYPLISMRAYISTAGQIGGIGNGTDSFTNWASRPDGRRAVMRVQPGDGVTDPNAFTTTSNMSQSPIVGLQYMARGRVISAVAFGDSISESRATYLNGGWGFEACNDLNAMNLGVAFEWSDLGWTGQSTQVFINHLTDDLPYFADQPFDIGFVPNYSPNDASTNPTNGTVRAGGSRAIQAAAFLSRYGTVPVIWTGLPTNTAQYNIGANDSFRFNLNTEATTLWAAAGLRVADFAATVQDPTPVNGQYQFLPGMTVDDTHPSDAGNTAMSAPAKRMIRSILGLPISMLDKPRMPANDNAREQMAA